MQFTIAISPERVPFRRNCWLWAFLALFSAVWTDSFAGTSDLANWFLENFLTAFFVIFFLVTFRRYQFSDLSYLLVCIYMCLHAYGSKHTYAANPLGNALMESFGFARNHYDRIVHFCFGFLLAYPMRELFLKWLKYPPRASWVLPVEITMSVSAFYELVEWAVADVFFPEQGPAYLGTQGDVWDAQKDIFLAFSGAILATTIVSLLRRILGIRGQ